MDNTHTGTVVMAVLRPCLLSCRLRGVDRWVIHHVLRDTMLEPVVPSLKRSRANSAESEMSTHGYVVGCICGYPVGIKVSE